VGKLGTSVRGMAVVYCLHNRQKRQVVDLAFDRAKTKVHLCACCENLFLELTDTPMFCEPCRRPPVFAAGGPLPPPRGAI
jgi:recombinational DNA repair protein RecR